MGIGKRLREQRKSRGLTLKALGEALSLSESAVSLYESEDRDPDPQMLARIADYFGVTIDYLMCRTDDPRAGAPLILPRHTDKLSPHMQEFLAKESAGGWPRLELLRKLEEDSRFTLKDLEKAVAFLMFVKRQEENSSTSKNS